MFYLEWLSFYSSFTLLPKRACISRAQKDNFFLEQGIVRVRANSLRREKFVFSCVAFCDTLRLSRNIRVPHFNFFLPFFSFFYLWSNKRRCCDEVHKAIMAINFTSRHGFSSFPNKTQSKKVNKKGSDVIGDDVIKIKIVYIIIIIIVERIKIL